MRAQREAPFERLLIANRGEIAVRIIRACAELGIRSIAVYSDADRDALHVRLADEAHSIGGGPAHESYLAIPNIIDAARVSGAQAIHPGYGFLSESTAFAEACAAAGLVFVGPSAAAMRLLGDKAAARRLAAANGVPIVPGYDGADQDDALLAREAERIGFPLLVKATAGGGGRGMRVVHDRSALAEALASARREAAAAFGDDAVILERLVVGARHVEVQLLGDLHGATIHLGERDCSVQRRHQKVIEESPGPSVTPDLRVRLGEAALRVARTANYTGAGTCEFLLEPDGRFWFMEMNARLQVEHPVTEQVTGFDLVRAQLEIAAGWPLRWRQEDVTLRGHAIECRLYAEDPSRNDLPTPGRLTRLQPPLGPGLRHDVGYADGDMVPPYYDTMLGKLIAWGEDRTTAIVRARAALDRYAIDGLPTNRALLNWILDHPTFRAGEATTAFLELARQDATVHGAVPPEALAAAVVRLLAAPPVNVASGVETPLGDWRLGGQGIVTFWQTGTDADIVPVVADREGRNDWLVTIGDRRWQATAVEPAVGVVAIRPRASNGAPEGTPTRCRVERAGDAYAVEIDGTTYRVQRAPAPLLERASHSLGSVGAAALQASMPGRIVSIAVAVGDTVDARQPLVIIEAMKIESAIVAPRDGVVTAIRCAVGEAVAGGQVLVELAPR